jgi:hypothetical protein
LYTRFGNVLSTTRLMNRSLFRGLTFFIIWAQVDAVG